MSEKDKKIIEKVLSKYAVGTLDSFELVKGGFVNRNFKVKTNKGVFFLREYLRSKSKSQINTINSFLYDSLFETAKPIRSNNGIFVVSVRCFIKQRLFAIFEFKAGQTINAEKFVKSISKEEQKLWGLYEERELNAARVLAKLHNSVVSVPKRKQLVTGCFHTKPIKLLRKRLLQAKKRKINSIFYCLRIHKI